LKFTFKDEAKRNNTSLLSCSEMVVAKDSAIGAYFNFTHDSSKYGNSINFYNGNEIFILDSSAV
jgi:hypothetical protein